MLSKMDNTSSLPLLDDPQKLKNEGNKLLGQKDYHGAISTYTKALLALDTHHIDSPTSTASPSLLVPSSCSTPSIRSILLSNRSHAYLSLGLVDKSLNDAERCIESNPTWYKGYLRRAKSFQTKGIKSKQNAIDSYEDAILAVERGRDDNDNSNSNTNNTEKVLKELKVARTLCLEELRIKAQGFQQLSSEVSELGGLLAVPETAKITKRLVLGATLEPATHEGFDERYNKTITGTCPGDTAGWPMFIPTITYKDTGLRHTFPLCYYILGPCILTKACAIEIDDMFRYLPSYACHWPEGKATRTCPFCGSAAASMNTKRGSAETFTLVAHVLVGRSYGRGFGNKAMVQLVCENCTRKHLLKSKTINYNNNDDDDETSSDEQHQVEIFYDGTAKSGSSDYDVELPLHRLRKLTDKAHAIKMSILYNRANNSGLMSSICLHAIARFQRIMKRGRVEVEVRQGNTNSKITVPESTGNKREFFEKWMSDLDAHNSNYKSLKASEAAAIVAAASPANSPPVVGSYCGNHMGVQEFGIQQVAQITDLQTALKKFWKKHGARFRSYWLLSLDENQRQEFVNDVAESFIKNRLVAYRRRNTSYHYVLDPTILLNEPSGKVPKHKLCILPECNKNTSSTSLNLLQLFRDRVVGDDIADNTSSSNKGKVCCLSDDIDLISKIKKENGLPKIGYKESNHSYLCDYMGLKDPTIGPFVVFIGEREPVYDSKGIHTKNTLSRFSPQLLMNPEDIIKLPEYHSLRQPIPENITIYSAKAAGESRNSLNHLINNCVATDAVCLIYAAQRQQYVLQFLQQAVCQYCILTGNDDPKEMEIWSYQGASACYVCAARKRPDGSRLLCCSKCKNINYCSPECQKRDWPRHKAESCVTSPHMSTSNTHLHNSKNKTKKGKKKGKKGKKK